MNGFSKIVLFEVGFTNNRQTLFQFLVCIWNIYPSATCNSVDGQPHNISVLNSAWAKKCQLILGENISKQNCSWLSLLKILKKKIMICSLSVLCSLRLILTRSPQISGQNKSEAREPEGLVKKTYVIVASSRFKRAGNSNKKKKFNCIGFILQCLSINEYHVMIIFVCSFQDP